MCILQNIETGIDVVDKLSFNAQWVHSALMSQQRTYTHTPRCLCVAYFCPLRCFHTHTKMFMRCLLLSASVFSYQSTWVCVRVCEHCLDSYMTHLMLCPFEANAVWDDQSLRYLDSNLRSSPWGGAEGNIKSLFIMTCKLCFWKRGV